MGWIIYLWGTQGACLALRASMGSPFDVGLKEKHSTSNEDRMGPDGMRCLRLFQVLRRERISSRIPGLEAAVSEILVSLRSGKSPWVPPLTT